MEIKGGAHHVIDPVLLHHAMHIVRERSTGKNGHVLATVVSEFSGTVTSCMKSGL